jgi:hypothetical protein
MPHGISTKILIETDPRPQKKIMYFNTRDVKRTSMPRDDVHTAQVA